MLGAQILWRVGTRQGNPFYSQYAPLFLVLCCAFDVAFFTEAPQFPRAQTRIRQLSSKINTAQSTLYTALQTETPVVLALLGFPQRIWGKVYTMYLGFLTEGSSWREEIHRTVCIHHCKRLQNLVNVIWCLAWQKWHGSRIRIFASFWSLDLELKFLASKCPCNPTPFYRQDTYTRLLLGNCVSRTAVWLQFTGHLSANLQSLSRMRKV